MKNEPTDYAIVVGGRGKLGFVQSKSLDPGRNAEARKFVREIVQRDFGGNVTAAAKGFGISQSLLYEFLNEKRGAGMKLLEGVAKYAGVKIDVVIGGEDDSSGIQPERHRVAIVDANNFEKAVAFLDDRVSEAAIASVASEAFGHENEKTPFGWGVELSRAQTALTGVENLVTRPKPKPPPSPKPERQKAVAVPRSKRRRAG